MVHRVGGNTGYVNGSKRETNFNSEDEMPLREQSPTLRNPLLFSRSRRPLSVACAYMQVNERVCVCVCVCTHALGCAHML